MQRIFKTFLKLFGSAVILFFLTAVFLPVFFNPKYHKGHVEKYLSAVIGLPAELGGKIDFTFFPQTSITFTDLSIKNSGEFEEKELISVQSGQVLMSPLSFFSRIPRFERVMLAGVFLNFEENENGVKNWSYLSRTNSSFTIDLLVITDGDFRLNRKPSSKVYHYSDMSLVLSEYSFGESSGFETEGVLNDLAVRLDGRISALDGELKNQIKIVCKADLSLGIHEQKNVVDNPPIFVGRIDGNIFLPEGDMNIMLTPHTLKKREERTENDPLVTEIFEFKGTVREPVFYLGGRSVDNIISMESSLESNRTILTKRLTDFVVKLSGNQAALVKQLMHEDELQEARYKKSDLGSISIGAMKIQ